MEVNHRLTRCLVLGLLASASLGFIDNKTEHVVFLSPTRCEGHPHGVYRWKAKIDQEQPRGTIRSVKPHDLSQWKRPAAIHKDSGRSLASPEDTFYELTGLVVLVRLEDDGDIHVQLQNETPGESAQVVVEIPLGPPWEEMRREVCSWSDAGFPRKPGPLLLRKKPVIRVVGKGFWDGDHAAREGVMRNYDPKICVWELHPVVRMTVLEHEIR